MLPVIVTLVLLALATSAASTTLARSKLTGPVRDWVRAHSKFWAGALSCPYCMAHWIGFVLVIVAGLHVIETRVWGFNVIVAWLSVVALATIFNGVTHRLNFLHEYEIERLEESLSETQHHLQQVLSAIHDDTAAENV